MKKVLFATIIMLFSFSVIQAQETEEKKSDNHKKEKIFVKLKDDVKPDIYVDGKKFDFPMELLDQSKIASIFVVKGEQALKKYNSSNGVILIKTKKTSDINVSEIKIKSNDNNTGKDKPKIIIDGKIVSKNNLDALKPDQIEKMEVIKGEQAIKKYNSPGGVIIITTKSEKR